MKTIKKAGSFIIMLTYLQVGAAFADTECPVAESGKSIVVQIQEDADDITPGLDNVGSAVIFRSLNKQKYYVLTNKHVVSNYTEKNKRTLKQYKVLLNNDNLRLSEDTLGSQGVLPPINLELIGVGSYKEGSRDKDFALLEFESNNQFNGATLAEVNTQSKEGNTVYATGFPLTGDKKFRCVPLIIIPNPIKSQLLTYQPILDKNNVDPGMSGSPLVSNNSKEVLGIHQGPLNKDNISGKDSKEGVGILLSVIEAEKELLPYFQEIRKAMEGGAEITSLNPINPGVTNIQNSGNKPFQGLFNKPVDGGYW